MDLTSFAHHRKKALIHPILLCLLSILSFSCSDSDDPENKALFYWEQTKCSDPWGAKENDTESTIREALGQYLLDNGINKFSIKDFAYVLTEGTVTCDSCGCPSGTVIVVEVVETYVEKMKDLGFKTK